MNFKNLFLDLVFPRACPGCGAEIGSDNSLPICNGCFDKIILNHSLQCHVCDLRNAGGACANCRKKTAIKAVFAAGRYEDPILREMIRLFKYQSVESFKKPLARLMTNCIFKENPAGGPFAGLEYPPSAGASVHAPPVKKIFLVPVPLTLKRKIGRGFNQSELLAEEIGKTANLPVAGILKRKKFSRPQAEIADRNKRKENVAGAFEINRAKLNSLPPLGECRIILIDDVSTGGATLEECAGALKRAGAKEIYALVAAKG